MTPSVVASLYLSRLLLNPRSRRVLSEVAHPYEMHRTLMRAFPQVSESEKSGAREEFGVLFRPETNDRRGDVTVYVQSQIKPDWSFLDQLGYYLRMDTETPTYDCRDIISAYQGIRDGQVLSFRLRANPTKRNARDNDPLKGKRVELQREEEQLTWLINKGKGGRDGVPGGFELLMQVVEDEMGNEQLIPRVTVRSEGKHVGLKKEASVRHRMAHLAVLFDGLLRVTERDAFLETVTRGVGSGKAYGFGLLSLAPARTVI
jgi:CRISPR system Cascade subunit CasE